MGLLVQCKTKIAFRRVVDVVVLDVVVIVVVGIVVYYEFSQNIHSITTTHTSSLDL